MKLLIVLCCTMFAVVTAFSIDPPDSRPGAELENTEKVTMIEQEEPTPSVEPSVDLEQFPMLLQSELEDIDVAMLDDTDTAMVEDDDKSANIQLTYSHILRYYRIRSFQATPRLRATFYNRSPVVLYLYWIDYHGRCRYLAPIRLNGHVNVNTYGSHGLIATTRHGHVRGIYIMYGRNAAVAFH